MVVAVEPIIKERPILFSAPMVQAIREGRKTQTRRVINPQPDWHDRLAVFHPSDTDSGKTELVDVMQDYDSGMWEAGYPRWAGTNPYGEPGDCLWVRETWAVYGEFKNGTGYCYRADGDKSGVTWKPSIHMPRKVSRITLEVTAIRVERVQDISVEDAVYEGMGLSSVDPVGDYGILWDHINAARGFGWGVNPWVWVVEFRPLIPSNYI
jgi:hypothetical protein